MLYSSAGSGSRDRRRRRRAHGTRREATVDLDGQTPLASDGGGSRERRRIGALRGSDRDAAETRRSRRGGRLVRQVSAVQAPRNDFKRRLLAGETLHGLWMVLASPVAAESLALVGFDWLLFDCEHAPVEVSGMQPLLQAAACGPSSMVVRPAWNDKVLIKRILDIGAQTILVPFVETPEEARAAVAATRYPPRGVRGVAGSTRASRFGLAPDYFAVADEEICVLVQIETAKALDHLEAIAAVPGVDGVFVGPADLGASLGFLGRSGAPEVQAAVRDAATRIASAGKAPGILATNADEAARYLGWGYRFVAGALDLGLMVRGAQAILAAMRKERG